MRFVRVVTFCLAVLLGALSSAQARPLHTAWLDEFEYFAAWYAHDQQWDGENGLSVAFRLYPTGNNLVDSFYADKWELAGCGGIPALKAVLRGNVSVLGIALDEAAANALYVRPDGPLSSLTPTAPDNAGKLLAGKRILCPLGTSAHQLVTALLDRAGLTDKDVVLIDASPESALEAFGKGMGDAVALWAPLSYAAEEAGFRRAADGANCGLFQPTLLLVDKTVAAERPDDVRAFMRGYDRATAFFRQQPQETLVPLYQRFHKETTGEELSAAYALRAIREHRLFDGDERKQVLAASAENGSLSAKLKGLIAFYRKHNALSHKEAARLGETAFYTPEHAE